MVVRYATALLTGCVATIVTLFLMQLLITGPKGALGQSTTRYFVDFVRVERDESFRTKERLREKPPEPQQQPVLSAAPRVDAVNPVVPQVEIAPPLTEFEFSVQGLGLSPSDGDYQPLVQVKPGYPVMAETRGIEGYCIVECTVTELGTVRDARVIESEPGSVFDKTSLEAVKRFKYVPRVIDGEPIAVRGVTFKFIFEIEDP